jgi:hypothetical protein
VAAKGKGGKMTHLKIILFVVVASAVMALFIWYAIP